MRWYYLLRNYLAQATVSISACALLYSSSLFARAARRSMTAGSSFNNADKRFCCSGNLKSNGVKNSIQKEFVLPSKQAHIVMKTGKYFTHIHFSQLGEEMVKQASFGLTNLTIDNGFGNRVSQSCTYHVDI